MTLIGVKATSDGVIPAENDHRPQGWDRGGVEVGVEEGVEVGSGRGQKGLFSTHKNDSFLTWALSAHTAGRSYIHSSSEQCGMSTSKTNTFVPSAPPVQPRMPTSR